MLVISKTENFTKHSILNELECAFSQYGIPLFTIRLETFQPKQKISLKLVLKLRDFLEEVDWLEVELASESDRERFFRRDSRRKEARKLLEEKRVRLRSRDSKTVIIAVSKTFFTFF